MIQICDIPIVVLISIFLTNFCYDFILAGSVLYISVLKAGLVDYFTTSSF